MGRLRKYLVSFVAIKGKSLLLIHRQKGIIILHCLVEYKSAEPQAGFVSISWLMKNACFVQRVHEKCFFRVPLESIERVTP